MSDINLRNLEQIFTTAIFHAPWVKDMKLLAKHGVQVYCFEFAYKGTMTIADISRLTPMKMFMNFLGRYMGLKWFQNSELGVCHADEMFYIFPFKTFGFPPTLKSSDDKSKSDSISGFIFYFAEHDLTENENRESPNDWKKLEPTGPFKVLQVYKNLNFAEFDEVKNERVKFWNEIIKPNENGSQFIDKPITDFYDLIAEKRLLTGSGCHKCSFNIIDSFYAFAKIFRCCCCCVTK